MHRQVVCTDWVGGTERGLVSITDGQEETMGVAVCAPTIDGRDSPINLGIMVLKTEGIPRMSGALREGNSQTDESTNENRC